MLPSELREISQYRFNEVKGAGKNKRQKAPSRVYPPEAHPLNQPYLLAAPHLQILRAD
jgi:hypothetical protein